MKDLSARIADRWLREAAAKGAQDLPGPVYVRLETSSDMIRASFCDMWGEELVGGPVRGHVEAFSPGSDTGPCLDAFIVRHASATRGWGPLLYDVVMEAAGRKGLTPDRTQVSASAFKVWDYYMNRRSDVKKVQLDWNPNSPKHIDNDKKNDCLQTSMRYHDPVEEDLLASPVSKVYYASGRRTIDTLEGQMGKLVRV
jgi:hypothetical protein